MVLGILGSNPLFMESSAFSSSIWQSSSHLGFAQSTSSVHSSGAKPASGSYVALDATGSLSDQIQIGWRTTGSGIKFEDADTLRFATGPIVRWIFYGVGVQLGIGYFQESSRRHVDDEEFISKGTAISAGLVRSYALSERLELAWGAGMGGYWGNYRPRYQRQSSVQLNTQRQIGQMRTVEFGIRLSL